MARNRSPLPRNTVAKKRSSYAPSRSRSTPMNQRKAIPANGSRCRARLTVFRSPESHAPASCGFAGTEIRISTRLMVNEPTPWAKAQGFRSTDMIWHNYRRCSLMYRRTTSSSTLPTVSAKYPSAQKLSPHKNSSNSGYSFLITRLVPPFNLCTTSATLSSGFVWMIRCMWSSWILSSLIHHLLIRYASIACFKLGGEWSNIYSNTKFLSRKKLLKKFSLDYTVP